MALCIQIRIIKIIIITKRTIGHRVMWRDGPERRTGIIWKRRMEKKNRSAQLSALCVCVCDILFFFFLLLLLRRPLYWLYWGWELEVEPTALLLLSSERGIERGGGSVSYRPRRKEEEKKKKKNQLHGKALIESESEEEICIYVTCLSSGGQGRGSVAALYDGLYDHPFHFFSFHSFFTAPQSSSSSSSSFEICFKRLAEPSR